MADRRGNLGETSLALPKRGLAWRNVLTNETAQAELNGEGTRLALGAVLSSFPVGVFEST